MAISEWDQRQLCPDGACVGVIGPDGTCKTCGRVAPDWGDERRRGLVATDDAGNDGDGDGAGDGGEEDEIAPSAPALIGEAAVWQRRRLCPDGACIGLLGPDGTCKVCGKSASAAAMAEEAAAEEEDEAEDEGDEAEDEGAEAASDEETNEEEEEEDEEDEEEEGADEGDSDDEDKGDADLGDRKLCPDGACIGVIGPDNRCKVCGKEAA